MFEFHTILTIWTTIYIKISCLLSADSAGTLFCFLFLANFVDGVSAYFFYFFTFISIFFSNERANPKTKESIWCGLIIMILNFIVTMSNPLNVYLKMLISNHVLLTNFMKLILKLTL